MCRETLEGIFALSMEVVRYRAYSEHRREPSATAPDQDPMPSLQWKDMKRSFIRCSPYPNIDSFELATFSLSVSQCRVRKVVAYAILD